MTLQKGGLKHEVNDITYLWLAYVVGKARSKTHTSKNEWPKESQKIYTCKRATNFFSQETR